MKPMLAIDFDDVVFPFMERFVPHYNEQYDVNFSLDDYWSFEFEKVVGGDAHEVWRRVALFFEKPAPGVQPLRGAREGLEALSDSYRLAIVTSRDESLRTLTEDWIAEMFPDTFESVHLCNTYSLNADFPRRSKLEVVELIDAVGLVDDSLANTTDIAASGRRGLLFGAYAWNAADESDLPANVQRVIDWNDVVEKLGVAA